MGAEPRTLWESTQWSIVARAGDEQDSVAMQEAWHRLLTKYEAPIARAIRRLLRGHPASEQILAEFPSYLYEQRILPRAARERGRFRCFLQGVLRRYVLQALRKHDGDTLPSVDDLDPAAPEASVAEAEDEAAWAMAVLAQATSRLAASGSRDGELLLRCYGIAPFEPSARETLCAEYGLERNALNQALHRARQTLRSRILEEVRETVQSPQDLHEEMGLLVQRLLEARPGLLQARP